MPATVAITLDLGCCRCKTKIHKILCCLQQRCGFVFDKVVYDKDKVLVSGTFDAMDLVCKLRCKAGHFATKIEIVPPPPPKKDPPPPPPQTAPAAAVGSPQQPVVTSNRPDPPPTCTKALIPYPCPYPYPYPLPCPSPQPRSCHCHSCKPPPCPTPPPPPPRPCPTPPPPCPPPVSVCKCPAWTPCQCRGHPWVVCCEENLQPDGPCAVM
ncbi:protein PYRICULARIA ORYZAE RESISTANCE 21 [Zea mays]|uniref:Uncharacterized protein n=2 Tax=Zea mays TaxID=4577 RepID=A0A1D6EC06_MAIZE|nr:protein PYRICULARIA ORYZAE RESISTANCE 21 [Zea mays]XP_008669483.1 protein PYRICULARIA ORYZAE RESISTANCE 21 [Zea mays]ONM17858.1 hypothetical protein ZEAMMB73_Zm00001d003865 [Zea mays]|eukprot:XP_008669482.1 protein PYRICULARIA ORYZAE RESISTANCE 21 [Zea mays]